MHSLFGAIRIADRAIERRDQKGAETALLQCDCYCEIMTHLIENLLHAQQISRGKIELNLNLNPSDIRSKLDKILFIISSKAKKKNL